MVKILNLHQRLFLYMVFGLLLAGCKGGFGGSTDAGLSRLALSPGSMSPSFSSETYEYTLNLAKSEDSFTVNARTSVDDATMQLRKLQSSSASKPVEETYDLSDDTNSTAITVEEGTSYFDLVVTSGDGSSEKIYDITVTRASEESTDTSLKSLEAENVNKAFDTSGTEYSENVNFFVNNTRIKAVPNDNSADFIETNGLALASDSYSGVVDLAAGQTTNLAWKVRASDRTTEGSYSLGITRAQPDNLTMHYTKSAQREENAQFGSSVAIIDGFVFVGEPEVNNGNGTGRVTVFTPSGNTWSQSETLSGSSDLKFGSSLAAHRSSAGENTLVVGLSSESTGGAVYVCEYTGITWNNCAELAINDRVTGELIGSQLAIHDDVIAVASTFDEQSQEFGRVRIFEREGSGWAIKMTLEGSSLGFGSAIGFADENTLLIGAPTAVADSDGNGSDIYQINKVDGNWPAEASDGSKLSLFGGANVGKSLDVKGDVAVVGAPDEENTGSGKVFIMTRDSSGGKFAGVVEIAQPSSEAKGFGASVAVLSRHMVAVGAAQDSTDGSKVVTGNPSATNSETGAVYLLSTTKDSSAWTQELWFKANMSKSAGDEFGLAIAASANAMVIGAPGEDSSTDGGSNGSADDSTADAGAVFIVD